MTSAPPDFSALFREHHDFVWRTLRHFGVAHDAIDDATQDVFVVVHRRLSDYDGRASMRSWLIGIARRVAARHRQLHTRRRDRITEIGEHAEVRDDRTIGPHSGAIRVEAAGFVDSFLQALPPKLRGVFQLCELEGMSAPQIAEALQIPTNTVYSRLRLARARFETHLARRRRRERKETS